MSEEYLEKITRMALAMDVDGDGIATLTKMMEEVRDRALIEAEQACDNVIKSYDVLKSDRQTYEPMRVQRAAKSMVRLAKEDIAALRTSPPPAPDDDLRERVAEALWAQLMSDFSWEEAKADPDQSEAVAWNYNCADAAIRAMKETDR